MKAGVQNHFAKHRGIYGHIVFWLLFLSMDISMQSGKPGNIFSAYFFISFAVMALTMVAPAYVNYFILIPGLFLERKYFLYFISLGLLIAVGIHVSYYFSLLVERLAPGLHAFGPAPPKPGTFIAPYIIFIILFSLAKFISSTLESRASLERLSKEKLVSELGLLKSQIHPHFLFNTLNTIYGMALKQSPQTPGVILQLSEMLRYVLYESDTERIDLEKEISYIDKYIGFSKLRLASEASIRYEVQGSLSGLTIAPLLLLPFIENSFKHGVFARKDRQWADINIAVREGRLFFRSSNAAAQKAPVDIPHQERGIGLRNVRARLDMLYKDRYTLNITEAQDCYSVQLELDLL